MTVVPISAELRSRRESVLADHLAAHNRGDTEALLASFARPRLELVASNRVLDGSEAVGCYLRDRRRSFPDTKFELIELYHADRAVICEYWVTGTHTGALLDMAPTGRRFRFRTCSIYEFEGADLVGQRLYHDTGTIARQLA